MSKSKQQSTSNDSRAKEGTKKDAKTKDMPTKEGMKTDTKAKDMPKTAKGEHKDKSDMNVKPGSSPKHDKHAGNKSDDKKTSKAK
ncbi:hypothetical protein H4218_004136 [Coemansia sp. IMI 209128]|uniref:Uncharacterized protein n=1 Tax=Coemansia linderi TaxID=2663919 RepID=A0ACC1JNG8_9FUNG|nr:hypothetical protein H4218_004136 [Coemansia sp. IMI 209128]KAJ2764148.1 hypothetical protein GGI18_006514 [Coemansia linderi]